MKPVGEASTSDHDAREKRAISSGAPAGTRRTGNGWQTSSRREGQQVWLVCGQPLAAAAGSKLEAGGLYAAMDMGWAKLAPIAQSYGK